MRTSAERDYTRPWWFPGLLEREVRGTDDVPGWASFIDRTLGATGRRVDSRTWQAQLQVSLRPLAEEAARDIDQPVVAAACVDHLDERLLQLAVRTLVTEMHRLREDGQLAGDSPTARFADFANQLANGGLRRTIHQYPLLGRTLATTCAAKARAYQEFCDRLQTDLPHITARLFGGVEPGPLTDLRAAGDDHGGGRSVLIARFGSGRAVVYKPRPLQILDHFNEIVAWLNGHTDLALRSPQVVLGDGYGWCEFVDAAPCSSAQEVATFYRRLGGLLAILYVLDGTDIHFENLIAAGAHPCAVDVETLFHPTPAGQHGRWTDPAVRALALSVRRTALLPQLIAGESGVWDVSGMGGDDEVQAPYDGRAWASAGTDLMHLVPAPVIAPTASNRPSLDGEFVEPRDQEPALREGFVTAYDAVRQHREELLALIGSCREDSCRYVVRMTAAYTRLLEDILHPGLLRRATDRDRFLVEALENTHDVGGALADAERADLWRGDIPMFVTRPGSRDLEDAVGGRHTGLLAESAEDAVRRKVAGLGSEDLAEQLWIISASLASRPQPILHRAQPSIPFGDPAAAPDPERALRLASRIGEDLMRRAHRDTTRANWLGLELIDEVHWSIRAMGAGLTYGYVGVSLFLAELGSRLDRQDFLDTAAAAMTPIDRVLGAIARDRATLQTVGCGLHGLGGIAYGLARLSTLLDDSDLRRSALNAVQLIEPSITDTKQLLADGAAGGLAAVLAVGDAGLPVDPQLVAALVDTARNPPAHRVPAGFLSGQDGIDWALARAGMPSTDRLTATADGVERAPSDDTGWCEGFGGITIADLAYGGPSTTDRYMNLMETCALQPDVSLCHGELGAIDLLITLSEGDDGRATAALERRSDAILRRLENDETTVFGTPTGVDSQSLLSGQAGVGYGLLRLAFQGHCPSLMSLESSPHSTTDR
ncbi:type 2 lanthipeptide synthetase LanM [Luteipulveratus mongoliensis]|uniref:type 2 lanthipeptide synthetase LanM n=1 Tax=Luteipulveratus mongoliensis TaxID=571913 RepID=UPI00069763E4|nr:type 2 lanthipeptide synthetase LanM [Luteipulveratus mongoliensis]